MPRGCRQLEKERYLNNLTYGTWFKRLYGLALSRFEWINLPDSVNERFLEMILFWSGTAVWFEDPVLGALALPVMATGPKNVYGIPLQRVARAYNGYHAKLTIDDSVLIYNNYTRTPDADVVQSFANRLYLLDRVVDVNINAQRTPVTVIADNDNQKLSMEKMAEQYAGNGAFIYTLKDSHTNIQSINTGAPFVADQLQTVKRQYLMEILNYLGYEANSSEKAERQIMGELTANMGGTEAMRQNALIARKQACAEINKMFGYIEKPVDVRFRSNLPLTEIMEDGYADFIISTQNGGTPEKGTEESPVEEIEKGGENNG